MSFDQPTVLTQRTCHLFVRGVPPFNVPPSCEHSNPLSLHNAHVICSCAAYPLLTCLRPMSKQTHCPYIAHVSFVRAQAYPLLTCLHPCEQTNPLSLNSARVICSCTGVPPFDVPPSCEHSNPLSLHNARVICSCAGVPPFDVPASRK